MKERTYRVSFKPEDIACTPPCGMEAALNAIDEIIRGILSRYADESADNMLRFGQSNVAIKNGVVTVYPDSKGDRERIISILKHHFSVQETSD
jgi:hypothetical protein